MAKVVRTGRSKPELAGEFTLPKTDGSAQILAKKWWILAILVVVLIGGLYVFRRQFVVAMVNGKPITRAAYISALEARGGASILKQMVQDQLIQDEALKQNVTVTPEEITQELTTIENNLKSQGQDINTELAAQGMTMSDLQQQIKMRQLVMQLTAGKATVSAEEINKYMADNKASLPTGKETPANITEMVRKQLEQQKQQEVITTWLQDLEKKANVQYF